MLTSAIPKMRHRALNAAPAGLYLVTDDQGTPYTSVRDGLYDVRDGEIKPSLPTILLARVRSNDADPERYKGADSIWSHQDPNLIIVQQWVPAE